MALLYADEDVPQQLIAELVHLGHDVFGVRADGLNDIGYPDDLVLARATALGRAVVTKNRNDYHKLHQASPNHAGIVTFTQDNDYPALARRIHAAIGSNSSLGGMLVRITRPHPSQAP